MTIDSLKELEKLIKLCRKTGVEAITIDGIGITLGKEPTATRSFKAPTQMNITTPGINENTPITVNENIDTPDELTEEQRLFYSALPHDNAEQQQ